MDIAFSDMGDFIQIQEGGEVVYHPSAVLKSKTKLIKKIKEKRRIITTAEGDGNEVIIESTIELELYDRQKSLDVLGKQVLALNPNAIMGSMEPEAPKPDGPQSTQEIVQSIRNMIGK